MSEQACAPAEVLTSATHTHGSTRLFWRRIGKMSINSARKLTSLNILLPPTTTLEFNCNTTHIRYMRAII